MEEQEIKKRFTHHAPKGNQPSRYEITRHEAGRLAEILSANCPESRELSLAMTNLEQAIFWANAAIARNE